MRTKHIKYFIFLTFFLYLFLVFDTHFNGPDQPIYFAYTASIIEDGDLNAVNHLDPTYPYYLSDGKIGISKTYNLPDFHNHGGIVLWLPFYIYAKLVYFIASKLNITGLTAFGFDRLAKCAMSFSTITFGFLAVVFTYFFCKMFFSTKVAIWSVLAIFLGTPFFHYMLREVGNANIIACLFSVLSIWFCSYAISMRKSHWFFYGLFFSICMVVKLDLWFQIIFILFYFVVLFLMKQTGWRNGIYFLLGLSPMFILKITNDYIKYGTFYQGEFGLLNFKEFYLFEQLFSQYRGFFYTSPIFYICLLGFMFLFIKLLKDKKFIDEKKMPEIFLIILSSYLFIKIFVLSYRYAWGGGAPGARALLTEFPIFVLLYAGAIRNQRKYLRYFIGIISPFLIFWNFLVICEYMAGIDLNYIAGAPALGERIKILKNILAPLFYIKDLDLKLKFCLPLVLVVFGICFYPARRFTKLIYLSFKHTKNQDNHSSLKLFSLFTIYLCTAYLIITLLNIFNNKKNTEKLIAERFFENARIISAFEFERQENVGSMNEMIEYFRLRGNKDKANKIKEYKNQIYGDDG